MKSSHKAGYLKSETHKFTSFDVGWDGDDLAEPLSGQESTKWGGFQCYQYLQYMFKVPAQVVLRCEAVVHIANQEGGIRLVK